MNLPRWLKLCALAATFTTVAVLASCDIDGLPIEEGNEPGTVCYTDEDCVPNGCCGNASRAVHVDEAPDCRGVQCTGSCDPYTIDCGCGIPVCRNSRCTTAVNYGDPSCG